MPEHRLAAEVAEIVRDAGKVPTDRFIGSESRLVDDLGVDSLDLVAIYLRVQDRYGVDVDDDDVAGLRTVGDLASYVAHRAESVAA